MKTEIKQQFLAALRSGKYQQIKGALKKSADCFCVQGVLCDLYSKEMGVQWRTRAAYHNDALEYVIEERTGGIPQEVLIWADATEKDEDVLDTALAYNDRARMNFPELADYLENNLE